MMFNGECTFRGNFDKLKFFKGFVYDQVATMHDKKKFYKFVRLVKQLN